MDTSAILCSVTKVKKIQDNAYWDKKMFTVLRRSLYDGSTHLWKKRLRQKKRLHLRDNCIHALDMHVKRNSGRCRDYHKWCILSCVVYVDVYAAFITHKYKISSFD